MRTRSAGLSRIGAGVRHQLTSACAAAGVTPHVTFEASASASAPVVPAELAERGLGVAILPSSVSRSRPGLHALTITPAMRGRLVLSWRSAGPMSPAARVLHEMARRLLRVGTGE